MNLDQANRIYFIGIGGIGMSALARYFHEKGLLVSGYDRARSGLTRQLEQEGIRIHFEEDLSLADRDADLVVYTPALPADNQELHFFRQNGNRLMKRSEVLQEITRDMFTVAVAGTHGKTTTSTLIAHLLRQNGRGCHAFLGGISLNYGTNFWSGPEKLAVVEADEYDRSFLKLEPDMALVTAMDPDHLDIYGTSGAMEDAYLEFMGRIKPAGLLIHRKNIPREAEFPASRKKSYALRDAGADLSAQDIRMIKGGGYRFRLRGPEGEGEEMILNLGGLYNIENALAAILAGREMGLSIRGIRSALENFRGVGRRFEYVLKTDRITFIDDYAHHPEELRALILGARQLYPEKKCCVVFQPHLYSRTRDLAQGFAKSLDLADEVILLPIYPARELPLEGISSQLIADKMNKALVRVLSKPETLEWLGRNPVSLLLAAGAGDIDQLVPKIRDLFITPLYAQRP